MGPSPRGDRTTFVETAESGDRPTRAPPFGGTHRFGSSAAPEHSRAQGGGRPILKARLDRSRGRHGRPPRLFVARGRPRTASAPQADTECPSQLPRAPTVLKQDCRVCGLSAARSHDDMMSYG